MAAAIPLMPRRPRSQCSHQRPQMPRRGGQREANLFIRGFDPRPITPLVSNSARGDQDRSSSLPQPPRRLSPEGVYLTWGTPEATLGESAELVLYIFFFLCFDVSQQQARLQGGFSCRLTIPSLCLAGHHARVGLLFSAWTVFPRTSFLRNIVNVVL